MLPPKLNPSEARHIGLKKTLKFLLIVWLICEVIYMVKETEGDFANGILFFIDNHFHYQVIVLYLSILTTLLLLGRGAGYDILIAGRKSFATGAKYIILSLLVTWTVIFVLTRIDHVNWDWDTYSQILVLDAALSLPIILTWICTIYSLRNFEADSEG